MAIGGLEKKGTINKEKEERINEVGAVVHVSGYCCRDWLCMAGLVGRYLSPCASDRGGPVEIGMRST